MAGNGERDMLEKSIHLDNQQPNIYYKKRRKLIMNEFLMELIKICDKLGLDVDGDVFTATSLYGQAEIFINAKKGVIRVIDRGSTTIERIDCMKKDSRITE